MRGLHSLNTRPGAQSQPDILRRMYILACEEKHLENKTEWLKRQKDQTLRRLGEIWNVMGFLRSKVSEKETLPGRQAGIKGNPGGKFNSVTLRY